MKHIVLLVIATCTMYAQQGSVDNLNWDGRVVYECNSIKSDGLKDVSRFMSDAASTVYAIVPTSLYAYGILASAVDRPSDSRRYASETAIQAAVSLGITYAVALSTKIVVERARPYIAYPDAITNGEATVDKYLSSFPSGHSAGAAAIATTMILRYPTWYVIAPSIGYSLWMGFSRMNLGAHFLTDVLAGYAIGTGIAYGVNAVSDHLFKLAEPILPSDGSVTVGLAGTPTMPQLSVCVNF